MASTSNTLGNQSIKKEMTKGQLFFKNNIAIYWRYKYLTLLMLPGLIYFIIFKYIPIYGLQIAFKDYRILEGIIGSKWVGFQVFQDIFMKPTFWLVLKNTLVISLYQFVFGFPAPIIFAMLMNEIRLIKFKKIVQTISYLPHFVSWVILGGLFMQFLSPSTGPINILLKALDITPIYFLADPKYFRGVLVLTEMWKGLGWGSIVYLAALSGIDTEIYEAAEIDGASRWKKAIHITLPSLTPIITIMLILATGKIINDNFDQVFNLYTPAVYNVGDVLSTYIYREGIGNMEYSFATAVGLFKNVVAFTFVLVSNSIAKKINEFGIW